MIKAHTNAGVKCECAVKIDPQMGTHGDPGQ